MDFVIFKDEILDIKNSERPKNSKESDDSCIAQKLLKQNKIYMTKQQRNIREIWVIFKRIISIIANFFILLKTAKKSLAVHVRKLLFKKYMNNHKIIFFNKIVEKKIT